MNALTTYIVFLVTLFLFAWLNAKFIKDVSGRDQYWHHVQFYLWIWLYISFGLIAWSYGKSFPTDYVIRAIGWGFMWMFSYNSLLNALRALKINHLGKYDKLSFPVTIILFLVGLLISILSFWIKL